MTSRRVIQELVTIALGPDFKFTETVAGVKRANTVMAILVKAKEIRRSEVPLLLGIERKPER